MPDHNAFLIFPLRGRLETRDFVLLCDLIMEQAAAGPSQRILLDWSEVTSWRFRRPSDRRLRTWFGVTAYVDRLAIVHGSIGHRQAALLGAVLRRGQCWVRSYRVEDHGSAVDWLTSHNARQIIKLATAAPMPGRVVAESE